MTQDQLNTLLAFLGILGGLLTAVATIVQVGPTAVSYLRTLFNLDAMRYIWEVRRLLPQDFSTAGAHRLTGAEVKIGQTNYPLDQLYVMSVEILNDGGNIIPKDFNATPIRLWFDPAEIIWPIQTDAELETIDPLSEPSGKHHVFLVRPGIIKRRARWTYSLLLRSNERPVLKRGENPILNRADRPSTRPETARNPAWMMTVGSVVLMAAPIVQARFNLSDMASIIIIAVGLVLAISGAVKLIPYLRSASH